MCSRENQNIFYYIKNKNFSQAWSLIKHLDKLTYEDTFMPIFCKFIGHKPYLPDNDNPKEWACKRCHQYIKYNLRKEKLKLINKKNGFKR